MDAAIHRIIEQQAIARADATAIIDGDRLCSYRELNNGANVIARKLMAHGFRRGACAHIVMGPGIELAMVLLAVLKAGGAYTWTDPGTTSTGFPCGISIGVGRHGSEEQFLHLDPSDLFETPIPRSANLPVLSRGTDIACILTNELGAPVVMVPHDTITSLRSPGSLQRASWTGEPGAFDLWMALMAGAAAIVDTEAAAAAAA